MNFDNFLQLFVVKERRFFPLFIQSAQNIKKASELLLAQTKEDDADERRLFAHRIKECETEGDHITDKIIDEVLDAYVTPFDRGDIHKLSVDMDTFLDCIRDSSNKIAIYQPKASSKKIIEIAGYICQDADLLVEVTSPFETFREDAKVLDDLCDMETDPIELVKKKNIIQALEDTSDVAKVLSNTIRTIVVKS